jgi:hypothetical protein
MATRADGLNALDRERAASVADEGGAAGAIAERQEGQPPPSLSPIAVALAGAAGVLMAIVAWRLLEGVTRKAPLHLRASDAPRKVAVFAEESPTPARPRSVPRDEENEP